MVGPSSRRDFSVLGEVAASACQLGELVHEVEADVVWSSSQPGSFPLFPRLVR